MTWRWAVSAKSHLDQVVVADAGVLAARAIVVIESKIEEQFYDIS
jgi:hypothetical protein